MPVKVKCQQCSKEKTISPCRIKTRKNHFCDKNCYSQYQKLHPTNTGKTRFKKGHKVISLIGSANPRWKGGQAWYCHFEAKRTLENKYGINWEEMIKPRDFVIHHIDRNRRNNSFGNLCVMNRVEHTTLHNELRREENEMKRMEEEYIGGSLR